MRYDWISVTTLLNQAGVPLKTFGEILANASVGSTRHNGFKDIGIALYSTPLALELSYI
jgi:hypothetical protein